MGINDKTEGQGGKGLLVTAAALVCGGLVFFLAAHFFRQPVSPPLVMAVTNTTHSQPDQVKAPETFLPVAMEKFITTTTHNWGDVPFGQTVCQDVPFDCQGAIRLNGQRAAREGKKYPGAVLGVPVGRRGACLHVLHAAENWSGTPPGAPYGKVLLHYANGESRTFYLRFRVHGMDWYGGSRTLEEKVSDPNSRLGWWFLRKDGTYRRFFHTIFANPLPDVDIVSADVISPLESANLWIFGLTIGNDAKMLVPDANEPPQLQRKLVSLRLVTSAGLPATNASVAWQAVVKGGTVTFPAFPADRQGLVVLDLPVQGIGMVNYMASAPDGTGCVGVLDKTNMGDFPEPVELEVKLAPGGATGLPDSAR